MTELLAAHEKIKAWRADPVLFVREVFHVEPDAWQAEALGAFARVQRLALKACKGPGKTTVLAWLGWNFLCTRPYSNVAATSISGDNLKDGLWKEFAKWQQASALLQSAFEWQQTRIVAKESPATWWASARQWSKSADANQQQNTLAGLHADHMLFLIDEAGGIPRSVAATAEAALSTGIETKLVIAGNPTNTEGPLWDACGQYRHLWYVIEVTGDPEDAKRSPRISIEWAKQQIEQHGKENPWVLVNVFGKFPPSSLNALLGPDEVNTAMGRHYHETEYSWSQKRIGVDVARFGDDRTVLFPRQGLAAFKPVEMRGVRTTDIAARVLLGKRNWGSEVEFIDDTGHWGHGVIDNLIASGAAPVGVQFHAPALNPRYRNRRAEMWLEMAEWVKRGGALPKIPELVGELTMPTYTFANGKFVLEDKDQIKERLGRSPDLADALALTFAIPDQPSMAGASRYDDDHYSPSVGHALTNYDPFA